MPPLRHRRLMMLFADDPNVRTTRACLDWVPRSAAAHVGCTVSALPVVLPARYEREGDDFVVTLEGSPSIADALDHSVVALHVEAVDPATGDPWWVLVIGSAALDGVASSSGAVLDPVVRLAPEVVAARPRSPKGPAAR